jgi:hypothetical protein
VLLVASKADQQLPAGSSGRLRGIGGRELLAGVKDHHVHFGALKDGSLEDVLDAVDQYLR